MSVDPMSYSNAKKSAQAQIDAANTSAAAIERSTQQSINASRDMAASARADFGRFLNPSSKAMATLQSALYGGSQTYSDPEYQMLTASDAQISPEEIQRMKDDWFSSRGLPSDTVYDYRENPGLAGGLPYRSGVKYFRGPGGKIMTENEFNAGKFFRGPNGEIVDSGKVPTLSTQWQPQESEGFKYTKSRTLQDLSRVLRMNGRGNSTYGMNATGRTLGELNANNEREQRNELWNLVKTGQGAAGTVTGVGTQAGNTMANAFMNAGQGASNAALMSGQARGSLYAGLSGANAAAMGNGLRIADMFRNNSGYSGGYGGGGYDAGGANFAGNEAFSGSVDNYGAPIGY